MTLMLLLFSFATYSFWFVFPEVGISASATGFAPTGTSGPASALEFALMTDTVLVPKFATYTLVFSAVCTKTGCAPGARLITEAAVGLDVTLAVIESSDRFATKSLEAFAVRAACTGMKPVRNAPRLVSPDTSTWSAEPGSALPLVLKVMTKCTAPGFG